MTSYGERRSCTIVGLALERPELDRRIARRLDRQFAEGFVEEVGVLAARPEGLSRTVRQALGYRELLAHLERATDLARRGHGLRSSCAHAGVRPPPGVAWFGRDPRVQWLDASRTDLAEAALAVLAVAGPAGAA